MSRAHHCRENEGRLVHELRNRRKTYKPFAASVDRPQNFISKHSQKKYQEKRSN